MGDAAAEETVGGYWLPFIWTKVGPSQSWQQLVVHGVTAPIDALTCSGVQAEHWEQVQDSPRSEAPQVGDAATEETVEVRFGAVKPADEVSWCLHDCYAFRSCMMRVLLQMRIGGEALQVGDAATEETVEVRFGAVNPADEVRCCLHVQNTQCGGHSLQGRGSQSAVLVWRCSHRGDCGGPLRGCQAC